MGVFILLVVPLTLAESQIVQGFDGRSARSSSVAIRHDVNGDGGLLFTLIRHGGTNLVDESLLKFRCGFQRTATDNQLVRIERVDRQVKKQAKRLRVDTEDFFAHGVAILR